MTWTGHTFPYFFTSGVRAHLLLFEWVVLSNEPVTPCAEPVEREQATEFGAANRQFHAMLGERSLTVASGSQAVTGWAEATCR